MSHRHGQGHVDDLLEADPDRWDKTRGTTSNMPASKPVSHYPAFDPSCQRKPRNPAPPSAPTAPGASPRRTI